jgi:ribosome biogenesis GTPase
VEPSFAALSAYGWNDRWAALYADAVEQQADSGAATRAARIVRHDGVAVLLTTPTGTESLPVMGKVDPTPVVGDWVVATDQAVAAVLPRASLLRRQDPGREAEQPLVANIDAVFITCGLDRAVKPGRIRRASALAWDAGAVPVVVLTKADLSADPDASAAEVVQDLPGVDVISTSVVTGLGLDALRALARDKTIVLLGESGAGKSSLTNALVGDADAAATGAVRSGDAKGRHTTSSRQLHPLPSGGVLVDTPGLRAIGLWVDEDAIAATVEDVESLAEGCRFSDCTHNGEPGCAVAAAIAAGELPAERLEVWSDLRQEAESAARRADAHAQRIHERRSGRMAREAQRRKNRPPEE